MSTSDRLRLPHKNLICQNLWSLVGLPEYHPAQKPLICLTYRWPLCLLFLPVLEFTRAESVTGKVSLMQCGYFFFGDLEKVFTVILRHQVGRQAGFKLGIDPFLKCISAFFCHKISFTRQNSLLFVASQAFMTH